MPNINFPSWVKNPYLFAFLMVVGGTLIRLHQLHFSLFGSNDFRKAQTAFLAREFAKNGIDLESKIPIFGTAAGIPMEFPLFQIFASILQTNGLSPNLSGMLVSLAFFQFSGIILWFWAKRWYGIATGNIAIALFEFVPYSLEWGASYLIESTALFFSLLMFFSLDGWNKSQKGGWLALAVFSAIVAFPSKITTAPGWLAPFFLLLVIEVFNSRRNLFTHKTLGLFLTAASGLIAGGTWTFYSDSIKSLHPITATLSSRALFDWNFGTISQRLDPYIYTVFGARTFLEIMGLTLLAVPFMFSKKIGREYQISNAMVLSIAVSGPLVFFNIYQHDYYFIALLPALVLLSAVVINRLSSTLNLPALRAKSLLTLILLVTLWTSFWGAQDLHSAFSSVSKPAYFDKIRQNTQDNDKLLVVGCDWNSSLLYDVNRRGLMIPDYFKDYTSLWEVENPSNFDFLVTCENKDYTYIQPPEPLSLNVVVEGLLYKIN